MIFFQNYPPPPISLVVVIAAICLLTCYVFYRAISFKRWVDERRNFLYRKASCLKCYSIDVFLNDIGLNEKYKSGAYFLLSVLADTLKISPEQLAYDYKMKELFCATIDVDDGPFDPFSDGLEEEISPLLVDIESSTQKYDKSPWDFFEIGMSDFLCILAPLVDMEKVTNDCTLQHYLNRGSGGNIQPDGQSDG